MDLVYKTTMLTQGGRSGAVQADDGSFKLKLAVHMAGPLSQADADELLERARGICPYVDATKNNVTLNLSAVLDNPQAASAQAA